MWVVWAGTLARDQGGSILWDGLPPAAGCRGSATEAAVKANQLWHWPAAASISAAQSLCEGTMSKAGAVVGYI